MNIRNTKFVGLLLCVVGMITITSSVIWYAITGPFIMVLGIYYILGYNTGDLIETKKKG